MGNGLKCCELGLDPLMPYSPVLLYLAFMLSHRGQQRGGSQQGRHLIDIQTAHSVNKQSGDWGLSGHDVWSDRDTGVWCLKCCHTLFPLQ